MGEAMNESEDKSADHHRPNIIEVTVMLDGLEGLDDAGDGGKFRTGQDDAVCLKPLDDKVRIEGEEYALMLAFAGENRNRPNQIHTAKRLRREFLNSRKATYLNGKILCVEFFVGRFEMTPGEAVSCSDYRQVVNVQNL